MKPLKPKDVAEKLNIPPESITIFARDIENANIYKFQKTPLGSFLFDEDEIEIIEEYKNLLYFFRKKKEALEILEGQISIKLKEKEKYPSWMELLNNAKVVT